MALALGLLAFRVQHGETVPASAAQPPNAVSAPMVTIDEIQLDYPTVEGMVQKSEDVPVGGFLGLRKTTLSDADGHPMTVTSAYNRYLAQWPEMDLKISWLADRDAAYSELLDKDLGLAESGARLHLRVGDFAQDGCSSLQVLYTLEDAQVTSMVEGDVDMYVKLLSDASCSPAVPADFTQCEQRAACLREHLQQSSSAQILQSAQLDRLRSLRVH